MILAAVIVLSVFASIGITSGADAEWRIETADASSAGRYTSIALDSSSNPHVSYIDSDQNGISHALKYAHKDAAGWHIETVGTAYQTGNMEETSIAIDSLGYPHIAYFDDNAHTLKYAHKDATGWQIRSIHYEPPPSDRPGYEFNGYCSIALDASDTPHISYYHGFGSWVSGLRYYDGSTDESVYLGSTHDGEYNSLALDKQGNPHISFRDASGNGVKYAYKSNGGWTFEKVSTSVPWYTSIALDSSGSPHISWSKDGSPVSWLYHAYKDANGWQNELISTQASFWDWDISNIAIDANNHLHICWSMRANSALQYAYKDASGWNSEAVASYGL